MKFSIPSFTSLAIVVSLTASSVAAPVPEPEFDSLSYDIQERAVFDDIAYEMQERAVFDDMFSELQERGPVKIHPDAKKFNAWVGDPANNHIVNAKPIAFYSGKSTIGGKATGVHSKMDEFCKGNGCQHIQQIIAKSPLKKATWNSNKDWSAVSKAVAKNAKGNVRVVTGDQVNKNSVWKKTEKPALKKNKKVTGIEHHHLGSNGKITKVADNLKKPKAAKAKAAKKSKK